MRIIKRREVANLVGWLFFSMSKALITHLQGTVCAHNIKQIEFISSKERARKSGTFDRRKRRQGVSLECILRGWVQVQVYESQARAICSVFVVVLDLWSP